MKKLEDYLYYHEPGPPDLKIYCGDCLEVMPLLPKVDLVVTDPPYGITQASWDSNSWIFKYTLQNIPHIIFGSQPFTSLLVNKFKDNFKHELIWERDRVSGFLNARRFPMKAHENILIFGNHKYFPQMVTATTKNHSCGKAVGTSRKPETFGKIKSFSDNTSNLRFPRSVLKFNRPHPQVHPTEKPKELLKWLVKTYSCEKDLILDPFLGSGTTLVACKELKHNGIGIEINPKYCEIAKKRLQNTQVPFL